MSSRNIANLLNQTGYIAVLAVGMTLVIVIRHIDLSVGFLSGFLAAIATIGMVSYHLPWYVVIPLALALGVVAGSFTAFLVAQLGIPAFVATLGGWLVYRGLLLLALAGTGTIIIADETFNAIGNGYIPDIFPPDTGFLPGVHKLTLLLGLAAIVFYVISEINSRRQKQVYHFEVLPTNLFILKLVFVSVLLGAITWVLAGYNGLSWTVVIMLIVVAVYQFMTTQTVLGRHIYADRWKSRGGSVERRQRQENNLFRFRFDGHAGRFGGHHVRLSLAVRYADSRDAVGVGLHRGGLYRRRITRRRHRHDHGVAHRCVGLYVTDERHEPHGHGHCPPVRRPRLWCWCWPSYSMSRLADRAGRVSGSLDAA